MLLSNKCRHSPTSNHHSPSPNTPSSHHPSRANLPSSLHNSTNFMITATHALTDHEYQRMTQIAENVPASGVPFSIIHPQQEKHQKQLQQPSSVSFIDHQNDDQALPPGYYHSSFLFLMALSSPTVSRLITMFRVSRLIQVIVQCHCTNKSCSILSIRIVQSKVGV